MATIQAMSTRHCRAEWQTLADTVFFAQKLCLKREKKKRDKEKFPPYPLYKKESGVVEKDEITLSL